MPRHWWEPFADPATGLRQWRVRNDSAWRTPAWDRFVDNWHDNRREHTVQKVWNWLLITCLFLWAWSLLRRKTPPSR